MLLFFPCNTKRHIWKNLSKSPYDLFTIFQVIQQVCAGNRLKYKWFFTDNLPQCGIKIQIQSEILTHCALKNQQVPICFSHKAIIWLQVINFFYGTFAFHSAIFRFLCRHVLDNVLPKSGTMCAAFLRRHVKNSQTPEFYSAPLCLDVF